MKNSLLLIFLLTAGLQVLAAQLPAPSDAAPGNDNPFAVAPLPSPEPPSEDPTSISIKSSNLQPEEPLVGEKDEEKTFTRELIQVQWRGGDPINLYVIRPVRVKKPPVILYLYSYPSNSERYRDDDFCKLLVKNGIAAVGFPLALNEERYHDRPMKQWFVSELQEALAISTHDVQMVLNYLDSRGDFDMKRVGIFGDGAGGAIAILAAAADARIKAVDLLNPWGDWPDWLAKSPLVPEKERANYLKQDFLQQVAGLDPLQWLPKLKSRTVRLQIVGDVTVTPKTATQKILAATPSTAQIVRYKDSRTFVMQAGLGGKVFDWLREKVGPAPPTAASREEHRTRESARNSAPLARDGKSAR